MDPASGRRWPSPVVLQLDQCLLLLLQSFAPPGWDRGMTRESVLAVVNMFSPAGVSAAAAAAVFEEEESVE